MSHDCAMYGVWLIAFSFDDVSSVDVACVTLDVVH